MSNGKVMIIHLTVGLIKKILLYKVTYFPEIHSHSKSEIKADSNLSNYVTKYDLKKRNRSQNIKICWKGWYKVSLK